MKINVKRHVSKSGVYLQKPYVVSDYGYINILNSNAQLIIFFEGEFIDYYDHNN